MFKTPACFGQVSDDCVLAGDTDMGMVPNCFGDAEAAFIEDHDLYMLNLELSDPFQFPQTETQESFWRLMKIDPLSPEGQAHYGR